MIGMILIAAIVLTVLIGWDGTAMLLTLALILSFFGGVLA